MKTQVTDEMVSRFLSWKLPADFAPDCYISFNPGHALSSGPFWPIGTNLLHAGQAIEMVEHIVEPLVTQNALLRAALVGLVGADTEDELRQMEATMRIIPAPEADKVASINAIHALLKT